MSPTAVPEPGWYPDPRGATGTYRWWDGAGWTIELTDDPTDAAPETIAEAMAPTLVPVIDPARTEAYAPTPRDPARRVRPDRVVAGVVVAVLVVAISLVVVLRSDGSARSAPPLAPPTPVAGAGLASYDEGTRKMRVGDVVATAPPSPWVTTSLNPANAQGLLTAGVISNVVVHAKYDGTADWTGTIVLGALDPDLVKAGDGSDTAKEVLSQLRSRLYGGTKTTTDKLVLTDNVFKGRAIAGLQTWVRFKVDGLATTADRLTILVIAPPAGSSEAPVVWISARPEDTPKDAAAGLQQALDSITLE